MRQVWYDNDLYWCSLIPSLICIEGKPLCLPFPFYSYMKKFLILLLLLPQWLLGASSYRTRAYDDKIQTIQLFLNDNQLDYPVLDKNSSDYVTVAFDYMSSNYPHLAYKIELCNADWSPSSLNEMEYLEGINEVVFDNPIISTNTKFDYAHFSVRLPNENLTPTLSGNYVIKVYDTDAPDKILMTGCFSICDNQLSLDGNVSGKSVYGVNSIYQHLTFELLFNDKLNPMQEELKVVVRQNGRHDNELFDLKPTYIKPSSMIFEDERKLSFEGGREYNVIDFSHRFRYSGRIERIAYYEPYYHVEVMPGKYEEGQSHAFEKDVNGHFKVHAQDVWSEAEIDYSIVHFVYPREDPWLDGSVYVIGGFNDNWLEEKNKMVYNFERHQYELALILKNGGYNYQYVFLPAGSKAASNERTEGSYWETENSYQIYVYYRPLGSNYDHDQLVGYHEIFSQR